jgi:hypothetical protein
MALTIVPAAPRRAATGRSRSDPPGAPWQPLDKLPKADDETSTYALLVRATAAALNPGPLSRVV